MAVEMIVTVLSVIKSFYLSSKIFQKFNEEALTSKGRANNDKMIKIKTNSENV